MMGAQKHLSILSYFLLLLITSTISAELCHPDDKRALFRIKESFNNAYIFSSWVPQYDCCKDWYMVECDPQTHRINDLYVTSDATLTGSIPDAIGDLPYLTTLEFHKLPNLTGSIPRSIIRLKNLSLLWLSNNNLSGPIPDFLGELKNLTYINLSFNNFTGRIPPSLATLPKLGALFLDRNRLTGTIPASFGRVKDEQNFYLRLTKNQLSGPIPKSIGHGNFSQVDLGRNNFTGDVSMFFGKDKTLQTIDISRNKFAFNMTNLEFPSGLSNLYMDHNMIYGNIPQAVANLGSFSASFNRLCGQIPNTSFHDYSFVHNKCLCGSPLPACK